MALQDVAPATPPPSWAAATLRHTHTPPAIAWFTCVTRPAAEPPSAAGVDSLERDQRRERSRRRVERHNLEFLQAAIVSARLNAPSLAPHVVYMHEPDQPLEPDTFSRWLEAAGARVILHRLSFRDEIPAERRKNPNVGINSHVNLGTYGRMDVPQLVHAMRAEFGRRGLDTEVARAAPEPRPSRHSPRAAEPSRVCARAKSY